MAGRYDSNPFDEEEVNPFAVSSPSPSYSNVDSVRVFSFQSNNINSVDLAEIMRNKQNNCFFG